jgi:hypothetical protein
MALLSRIAALHIDGSAGRGPFNGRTTGVAELRLSGAWCRWPAFTLAYVTRVFPSFTTAFVSAESAGFHPSVFGGTSGIELQWRWLEHRRLHVIATAGTGSAETGYEFWRLKPPERFSYTNASDHIVEGHSTSRYTDASVGVELTLAKLLRVYSLVGARRTGRMDTPELSSLPFNGAFGAVTLGFGKFR